MLGESTETWKDSRNTPMYATLGMLIPSIALIISIARILKRSKILCPNTMKMNLKFYRYLGRTESSVEDDYWPFEVKDTVSFDKKGNFGNPYRTFWPNGSRPW